MITAAFALLWVAGALLLARVVVGPSLADRIVALDGVLIVIVCGVAANAARTGSDVYTDIAVVIGLLGFLGTTVAARFIERRGA